MEEERKPSPPEKQPAYQPGEKGFAAFLLAVGLFFTWQSWLLYAAAPGASSYGAVPLACSCLIDLFAAAILIVDRNKRAQTSGLPFTRKLKSVLHYLVPRDIVVMIALCVLYCAALYVGLGFMAATPLFLWASMSYLMRGRYLTNLLWSALCMVFIYIVFRLLFSVVLP